MKQRSPSTISIYKYLMLSFKNQQLEKNRIIRNKMSILLCRITIMDFTLNNSYFEKKLRFKIFLKISDFDYLRKTVLK